MLSGKGWCPGYHTVPRALWLSAPGSRGSLASCPAVVHCCLQGEGCHVRPFQTDLRPTLQASLLLCPNFFPSLGSGSPDGAWFSLPQGLCTAPHSPLPPTLARLTHTRPLRVRSRVLLGVMALVPPSCKDGSCLLFSGTVS